ncbi:hypothetical protein ACQ26G_004195 [Yersinia enterocolitica]
MKIVVLIIASALSFGAYANGYIAKCGPYSMVAKEGQMNVINGERVTSQKITFLGDDGIKIDMGLMPARDGNNYGFEYIHRPNSEKRWLNVQFLQHSMDAPRIIGSFPCKKVPD